MEVSGWSTTMIDVLGRFVCNRGNQGRQEARAFRPAVDSLRYGFTSRWTVWGRSHLSVHHVSSLAHLSSASVLQDEPVETKEGQTVEEGRYEAACQKLATEAVRRGCADNVTVILISIDFWHISLSRSHTLAECLGFLLHFFHFQTLSVGIFNQIKNPSIVRHAVCLLLLWGCG